jgi:hypothetical protein
VWGYPYKAHLRGLNSLFSLTQVGFAQLAAPFYGDGGIPGFRGGLTPDSPTVSVKKPSPWKGGAIGTKPTQVGYLRNAKGFAQLAAPFYGDGGIPGFRGGLTPDSPTVSVKVVLTLEGWGYRYKAHLRGLNSLFSLTQVGFAQLAAPFYGDGGIPGFRGGLTPDSPTVSVKVVGDLDTIFLIPQPCIGKGEIQSLSPHRREVWREVFHIFANSLAN